jgi:hypothetical protein
MRRLLFIVMLAALLAVPAHAFADDNVFRAVPGNPADKLAKLPIDSYSYDEAKRCLKRPQKGMLAVQSWLEKHAGGVSWGIMRCEKWGKHSASLHAEGRAIDWHLSARNPKQKRQAEKLIRLMLAPDKDGNQWALARRMGVQEIIFNCRAWWGGEWVKYSACYNKKGKPVKVDDTTAHRDHIHFGLSKRGAAKRTSFWKR